MLAPKMVTFEAELAGAIERFAMAFPTATQDAGLLAADSLVESTTSNRVLLTSDIDKQRKHLESKNRMFNSLGLRYITGQTKGP